MVSSDCAAESGLADDESVCVSVLCGEDPLDRRCWVPEVTCVCVEAVTLECALSDFVHLTSVVGEGVSAV